MAYVERYVTDGAGGGGVGSEGDPWTLAEGIANVAAGERINLLSDGTYTLGADATFPNGLAEQPIEWRGYNSTIGDLEDVGRFGGLADTGTGELSVTDFPVIDGVGSWVSILGTFSGYKNIKFTNALDGATVSMPGTASTMWRCLMENTHATGASVRAFLSGAAIYGHLADCDFAISSTNGSAVNIDMGRGRMIGCRGWNTASPNGTSIGIALGQGGAAIGCIVFNVGRGIQTGHGNLVAGNTIYNCAQGLFLNAGGQSSACVNNIIYSMSGYAISGNGGGAALLWNNAAGAHTVGRFNTGALGTDIEEVHAILLTADPFVDAGDENFTLNKTSGGGALCRGTSRLFSSEEDLGAAAAPAGNVNLLHGKVG